MSIYKILERVIYRAYLHLKHLYGFHSENCLMYLHVMKDGFRIISKDKKSEIIVCIITKRRVNENKN